MIPDLGESGEGDDGIDPGPVLVVGLCLLLRMVVQLHLHLRWPRVEHMLILWGQGGLQDAMVTPEWVEGQRNSWEKELGHVYVWLMCVDWLRIMDTA